MIYPLKEWEKVKRGYKFGEKTFYSEHHLGVDHVVPTGTPIYAPTECEVILAANGVEGGNTANVLFQDVNFGPLVMRYMHLRDLPKKGKCKEGDVIGYTGNTGKLTRAPHLHTDISKERVIIKDFNNFIDPEKYFSELVNKINMMTYKKSGEPAIYVLVGNILIPFVTSFEVYNKEFKNAKLVILSAEEFSKYRVSETVKITE